jgi:hypothetical protein
VFVFPRRPDVREPVAFRLPVGLTLGNHVEFETRLGGRVLKQGFALRTMTYDGRLEL